MSNTRAFFSRAIINSDVTAVVSKRSAINVDTDTGLVLCWHDLVIVVPAVVEGDRTSGFTDEGHRVIELTDDGMRLTGDGDLWT